MARAIYIMCDGQYRKIGIAVKPSARRGQIELSIGKPVKLLTAIWFENSEAVAKMERHAHILAGQCVRGREWFDITDRQAYDILEKVIEESGEVEIETPHETSVTESAARAHRKYMASLLDKGYQVVAFRLSRKDRDRLDLLAKSYGSRKKVIEALLSPD